MPVGNYVIGDPTTKIIIYGPFVFDPVANPTWQQPVPGSLLTVAAAKTGGYTYPTPAPDPASTLLAKIPVAIAANNTFLALAAPTNAQVVTQVQRMTRQLNALGRLVAQLLDDTSDT